MGRQRTLQPQTRQEKQRMLLLKKQENYQEMRERRAKLEVSSE
jgi:hypothetical protein